MLPEGATDPKRKRTENDPLNGMDAGHLLAGDELHAPYPAASRARPSSWATASQPSAASRRLARTSSSVSPWVWHPGSAGMEAEKPPASGSGRTIAVRLTVKSTA